MCLTQHGQGEDWVRGLSANTPGSHPTSALLLMAEKDTGVGTDPPGDKSVPGTVASQPKAC